MVVEFRKHNNAYNNLVQFIEIADTVATLQFYLDSVRVCLNNGYLTQGEADKLMEQGRAKRLGL